MCCKISKCAAVFMGILGRLLTDTDKLFLNICEKRADICAEKID